MRPPTDVTTCAASLSQAQARAVLRGCISDEQPRTIAILLDQMLFYREPTIGTRCYSFELTKFGRAVDAQLRVWGRRP